MSRCIQAYFDAFSAYQDIANQAWPMEHLLARAIGISADRLARGGSLTPLAFPDVAVPVDDLPG